MEFISNSEKETLIFAQSLAKKLHGGQVVALSGDLGSGKTVFAKGIAQGLGIENNVTSPTFVIAKKYEVLKNKSINKLIHIDSYRLKGPEDAESIGIDEYLNDPEALIIIEWPEIIYPLIKNKSLLIQIEQISATQREIKIC